MTIYPQLIIANEQIDRITGSTVTYLKRDCIKRTRNSEMQAFLIIYFSAYVGLIYSYSTISVIFLATRNLSNNKVDEINFFPKLSIISNELLSYRWPVASLVLCDHLLTQAAKLTGFFSLDVTLL